MFVVYINNNAYLFPTHSCSFHIEKKKSSLQFRSGLSKNDEFINKTCIHPSAQS